MNKLKLVLVLVIAIMFININAQTEDAPMPIEDNSQAETVSMPTEDSDPVDEPEAMPAEETAKPQAEEKKSEPKGKNYILKRGFSVNYVMGFQGKLYGLPYDNKNLVHDDYNIPVMMGLKIGNRWYFYSNDKFGVGLMVNWLEYTIGASGSTPERLNMTISLLELGPVFSLAFTPSMGIDAYYNLKPTVSVSMFESPINDIYVGSGTYHAIGAAFRWKVLNVAAEYTLGKLESVGENGNLDKIKLNGFRLLIGAKF